MTKTQNDKCESCANTTVWICLFECIFIAIFKVVIGLASGSKAMLGSALYSLTDVVSGSLLIVSRRISSKPADIEHPYGHGKIEHIVSLLISLIILLGTVAVILVSAFSLLRVDLQPLHWIGLWASLACLCLSQIVYRLLVCVGKQTNSPAMAAHARHVRLDSISNIAVVIAILAAEVGYREVDAIIAIFEAVHVLFECSKMLHRAINNLMDASIDEEFAETIHSIVARDPNVKQVRDIKGKHLGRGISLDIEVLLDGHMKIWECNDTVEALKKAIRRGVAGIENIQIHYHSYRGEETDAVTA